MTLLHFSSLAGLEVARLIRSGQLGKGSHQKKKTTKFWTLSERGGGSAPQPNFLSMKSMDMCIEGGGGWSSSSKLVCCIKVCLVGP